MLEAAAAPLLAEAHAQSQAQAGAKVRLAGETRYQAGSWARPRRVIYKAEILAKGPNTRFVVTTRTAPPLVVYDEFVDRGAAENWIKDLKHALQADRLSCHRFWANALRLLLHAAAYGLLDTLRHRLAVATGTRYQLDTLRLRLLKIGGWLSERWDRFGPRLRLHLSSHHPGQPLWQALAARPKLPVNNPG